LVADDLARGRTKTTFVRVHGSELSAQAEHEAEKLNDDPVAPNLHGRIQAAIKLASDIGGAIDHLRTSPQDQMQARVAQRKRHRWADEARKLAESV
jgi:queuine/archaeosine tRNA-ribosyltransferase